MRKLVQALLAVGAMLPGQVWAQDGAPRPPRERGARGGDGGPQQEWRAASRPDRGAELSVLPDPRGDGPRGGWRNDDRGSRPEAARPVPPRDDDRRDWRNDDRGGRPDWNRAPDRRGWNDPRRGDRGGWNRDWRQDRRYDWNDWRARNRGTYRLPRYYAPYGWDRGYRRFGVGIRLSQPFFAQDYWIADPWGYRLPPADGPYRWVRYYNDALLVDLRYGTVVDVVYDIFF